MSAVRDVDIVIVGGGMAGGMLAVALAAAGLDIHLLDAAAAPNLPTGEAEQRVVSLTEASCHLLKNTGVWPHLDAARLAPFEHMQVWDSDGCGRVAFHARDLAAPALGYIVENRHLVAALHARVTALDNVIWQQQVAVTKLAETTAGWQVTLANGESLNCRLLIGADGARSMVRDAAGISVGRKDSGHRALVTRLTTEKPHGDCARQWFMTSGPLAFLPLFGDGHQVSIVWSAVETRAHQLAALSSEELAVALERASEGLLGHIRVETPPVFFPVHELHAADYISRQVALVGDAAHVIHPLAGQGINLGLLDAAVLAEEVLAAVKKQQDFASPALLARYQRRRRGHNLMMQQSMRAFQTLFAQQPPALRWLRNTGMAWINRAGPLKQRVAAEALGRHGDLPALARPPAL